MKFFFALAALVAVAVAGPLNKPLTSEAAELEAIIAAIQSPSTDPATAALLEQQLHDILGTTNPIVGPAIILPEIVPVGPVIEPEIKPEPISVGPAFIDFPLPEGAVAPPQPDGGAVTVPNDYSPVVVGPIVDGAPAPLVQIILNINQAAAGGAPAGAPAAPVVPVLVPALIPEHVEIEGPNQDAEPVIVAPVIVEPIIVEPVIVVDTPEVVDPVIVATPDLATPIIPEPVIIGTPILPVPVIIPEILN